MGAKPTRRNKVSHKSRRIVFARDNFTCQKCGWSAGFRENYDGRYTVGGPDFAIRGKRARREKKPGFRYLELDHIHPYSLGGPSTIDNLQALCDYCNACKGARV